MCNIIYIYHLQAIYKDVNSKAYLLRLSSFLIYIYTIVHLIYFFFNTVFNSFPFWFMRFFFFFNHFSQNFFIQVMFHSRKVMSDSSEIFCHC
uniref:Uncharacterized protein n=1 Tax=Dromaius novaehollandiae TaxID=8790 RepID=A0A8C4KVP0_DRONO